jgi:hypothetical protein
MRIKRGMGINVNWPMDEKELVARSDKELMPPRKKYKPTMLSVIKPKATGIPLNIIMTKKPKKNAKLNSHIYSIV